MWFESQTFQEDFVSEISEISQTPSLVDLKYMACV